MPAWYYMLWLVVSVACTFIGAAVHSVFVVVWNMAWVALYLHLYNKARDAGR